VIRVDSMAMGESRTALAEFDAIVMHPSFCVFSCVACVIVVGDDNACVVGQAATQVSGNIVRLETVISPFNHQTIDRKHTLVGGGGGWRGERTTAQRTLIRSRFCGPSVFPSADTLLLQEVVQFIIDCRVSFGYCSTNSQPSFMFFSFGPSSNRQSNPDAGLRRARSTMRYAPSSRTSHSRPRPLRYRSSTYTLYRFDIVNRLCVCVCVCLCAFVVSCLLSVAW
jgi:hypothetical protein